MWSPQPASWWLSSYRYTILPTGPEDSPNSTTSQGPRVQIQEPLRDTPHSIHSTGPVSLLVIKSTPPRLLKWACCPCPFKLAPCLPSLSTRVHPVRLPFPHLDRVWCNPSKMVSHLLWFGFLIPPASTSQEPKSQACPMMPSLWDAVGWTQGFVLTWLVLCQLNCLYPALLLYIFH